MLAEYIRKKAADIKKMTGNADPFEAAEMTGAKISFKDLGSLKGAYLCSFDVPVIIINQGLDDNMQKIVCAHELGHHILHQGINQSCISMNFDSSSSIYEREANIFAAAFIIDFKKAAELLFDGYSISQTAAILETDIDLLKFLLSVFDITEAPDADFLSQSKFG